jgi:hypothetical protein
MPCSLLYQQVGPTAGRYWPITRPSDQVTGVASARPNRSTASQSRVSVSINHDSGGSAPWARWSHCVRRHRSRSHCNTLLSPPAPDARHAE